MRFCFVLFSVISLSGLLSCGNRQEKARLYHEAVVERTREVTDRSLALADGLQTYELPAATAALREYDSLVSLRTREIEALGDFEGDSVLRCSALQLLRFYSSTMSRQLAPWISRKGNTSFNKREKAEVDSLVSGLVMEENRRWANFDQAEKLFVGKYGFQSEQ